MVFRVLAGAALAAAVLAGSAEDARAQSVPSPGALSVPDTEVPRYPPSSVRTKLIVGGLAIAGLGYGAAFLGAEATPTWPGSPEMKVPVIGPWWALAKNGCPLEGDLRFFSNSGLSMAPWQGTRKVSSCDAFVYLRAGLLVLDGLLQAAGLAIVAEAIVMKTEAAPAAPKPAAAFTWKPAPFVTPTSAGVGFVGTF